MQTWTDFVTEVTNNFLAGENLPPDLLDQDETDEDKQVVADLLKQVS